MGFLGGVFSSVFTVNGDVLPQHWQAELCKNNVRCYVGSRCPVCITSLSRRKKTVSRYFHNFLNRRRILMTIRMNVSQVEAIPVTYFLIFRIQYRRHLVRAKELLCISVRERHADGCVSWLFSWWSGQCHTRTGALMGITASHTYRCTDGHYSVTHVPVH